MIEPLHFDVERHRLDNGLRVNLHRDDRLPLASVNLWYHVGSKNEVPGQTGFAHLFEHLLFQGSEHVDTNGHFRYVQQVGGLVNGSTWYDRTNYFETMPSHHLDRALWLESDRMGFLLPTMTQQKLDTQREVVINERRQRVDNQPYGIAWERLSEMFYPEGHPYRWPVIGYMEDLEAATLDMVSDFFRRFYGPNNAVLTLAGDLPDDVLDRVDAWFGGLPSGPPVERPQAEPVVPSSPRHEVIEDDVQLAKIYLAWHGPAYGEAEWYAGDLLSAVMSGGKSSLLREDLIYRRRLAKEVSCQMLPTELCGTFAIVATPRPGIEPQELQDALLDHLSVLSGGGAADSVPAQARVDRARNKLLTYHYDELETLASRADSMSQFTTFFDDPEAAAHEPERYLALGPEDLSRYARERLAPERMTSLWVAPGTKQTPATPEGDGA